MLWRVTNRWQATQRAALAPCDLTHVQFVVLAALAHRPAEADAVSQRELAELATIDVMMASQVIRTLESKGLVTRRPHPADKRAQAISITAAGVDAANDAVVRVERADAEFFAALPGDRARFVDQLRALAQSGGK
ncbi:MAG: MarR family transcriptional regulator [Williamsia sp.]|nr:MarR family transcriptional regulator [Williamsia sp.]